MVKWRNVVVAKEQDGDRGLSTLTRLGINCIYVVHYLSRWQKVVMVGPQPHYYADFLSEFL